MSRANQIESFDLVEEKADAERDGWVFSQAQITREWEATHPTLIGFTGYGSLEKIVRHVRARRAQIAASDSKTNIKFEIVGSDDLNADDSVYSIELSRIVPSPFEPQARRRKKFTDADTASLAASIKSQGLLQPIVLRPVRVNMLIGNEPKQVFQEGMLEIVFGERRWRAMLLTGQKTIKAFVRDLTDASVLEMQYRENHERQANEPLDDAFTFKYLHEHENYSIDKLADNFAVTKKEVTEKLSLNNLITEAQIELEQKKLPLRHAYYLAKFPAATQRIIVNEKYAYQYNDIDEGAVPYAEFKEIIEENILRNLATAPFDKTDARLHIKGLLCGDCTERSGYEPALFSELKKGDSCLNQTCFELKKNTHFKLQRESIAAQMPNPQNKSVEEIVKKVPLVSERVYATVDDIPFKEKPLTNQKIYEKPECEFSELSLAVDGAKKGQQVYICRKPECPVHHPKPDADTLPAEDLKAREESFNEEVARKVHLQILKSAVEWFDDYKVFWTFDDLIKSLIYFGLARAQYFHDDTILNVIKDWKNAPKTLIHTGEVMDFVESLDKRRQSQILFLFTQLETFATDSIGEIKKIAKDYAKLDYTLLDAEARFEFAPEEFKADAADYLAQIRNGIPAEIPHFWYEPEEQVEQDDGGDGGDDNAEETGLAI